MRKSNAARSDYQTVLQLLNFVRKHKPSVLPLQLLRAMVDAWTPYVSLFFTARLIDCLAEGHYAAAGTELIFLLGSSLLLGVLGHFLSLKNPKLHYQAEDSLQLALREKALELDYGSISDPEIARLVLGPDENSNYNGGLGSLISHVRTVAQQLLSAMTAFVMTLILCFSPGTAAGALRVLASPALSLAVVFLALTLAVRLAQRVSHRFRTLQQQNLEEHVEAEQGLSYLAFHVFLDLDAGKVIRLYQMRDMLTENYNRYNVFLRKVFVDMGSQEMRLALLNQLLGGIFSIVAYAVVLLKVLAGAITIGAFAQYAGALAAFQSATLALIAENEKIRRQVQYLGKYLDFLALESSHTGTIPVEKRQDHVYELEFHHVSFAYPGSKELALKDVSCKLTLKDKMAVVGRNGAGKTTFIKLLCRLYDPMEGCITLNGVDIRKYDYWEYQTLFGVVFQDFQLFPFAVGENVAASLDYDRERLWHCLAQAGAEQRVRAMGPGLDTVLSSQEDNGEDISGGEAQKLAIARALYKDAPFVVLDEPTAALDPLSEYEIYRRFDELVEGKTSIYISHRMSSCRFCNDILVFDNGQIAERGSHAALLAQGGLYSQLWSAQAQYYTAAPTSCNENV